MGYPSLEDRECVLPYYDDAEAFFLSMPDEGEVRGHLPSPWCRSCSLSRPQARLSRGTSARVPQAEGASELEHKRALWALWAQARKHAGP